MFFLAAVEFKEQNKLALLEVMAAILPSTIPKGMLKKSLILNVNVFHGFVEVSPRILVRVSLMSTS